MIRSIRMTLSCIFGGWQTVAAFLAARTERISFSRHIFKIIRSRHVSFCRQFSLFEWVTKVNESVSVPAAHGVLLFVQSQSNHKILQNGIPFRLNVARYVCSSFFFLTICKCCKLDLRPNLLESVNHFHLTRSFRFYDSNRQKARCWLANPVSHHGTCLQAHVRRRGRRALFSVVRIFRAPW